jgi:type IV pilus assembly protein PilA
MKKLNKKGFTLAELLIVVAIIAVLVAIAIPIFSKQLEKSREETDIANMRSAKAGAIALMLSGYRTDGETKLEEGGDPFYFDAGSGEIVEELPSQAYGKGTAMDGGTENFTVETKTSEASIYERGESTVGKVIQIDYHEDTDNGAYIVMSWTDAASS